MIRYFIRPVGLCRHRSHTWAPMLEKAQEMKTKLQKLTGLKWRITKQEIVYGDSVQR